ncbi:hypothetical protein OL233_01350 [Vagococcus sp. PNs007]|uniref:Uncharacterized protein n=1 Tax=Vagococcus proximus TaxID=2991417 RepID=A0ABT5WYU5_9ENTE|nr:hypothetical protein [Vagococcus proximus]MDF0478919.1 hypothetical protein [Vagococcus proximus]
MLTNKLIQTKANLGKIYELREADKVIGRTEIPLTFKRQINSSIANKNYKLQFSYIQEALNWFVHSKNMKLLPFQIYDETNVLVGSVCERRARRFFGYSYFELIYKGESYYFYKIGLGKKGLKILMYNAEDSQVGLIEKDSVFYDNKRTYTIHTLNRHYQMLAYFFSVYFNNAFYSPNEVVGKSKHVEYEYTFNKELKNKYDPSFLERRYEDEK